MDVPLAIENFTKIYKLKNKKTKVAVDSLSIEVPQGAIFGFLGPNGAGKTTTIKTILDFIKPTHGNIRVFGMQVCESNARAKIGYLPEQPYFHKFLKPIELVSMHASMAGVAKSEVSKQAMRAIERAGIAEYANIQISKLSKGLTQRVGIAQAIVGEPQLLILDEPTSGLDPIGRRHTRDLFVELKNEGKTLFLSSHLLGEIESLCDIVAIMKNGKLQAYGSPDEVRAGESMVKITIENVNPVIFEHFKFLKIDFEKAGECAYITTSTTDLYQVMRALEEMKLQVLNIQTQRETLEEAFLRLAA